MTKAWARSSLITRSRIQIFRKPARAGSDLRRPGRDRHRECAAFQRDREALERQTATADILKVIASSPSDVQPVFDAIASSSKRLIGGFSATVFRFVDGIVNLVAYTPVSPAADQVLKASFPRPTANLPFFELAKGGEVVQEADSETNPDAGLRV